MRHDPTATIIVNKELAARGQLHTAIALWFSYGDPVSIHTLAAAAQGILQGLAGKDHQPYIADLIIADAALLHQDLYGLTPFIRAFTIRLSFEQPGIFETHELSEKITQGIRIDDLGSLDRPAFLDTVFARFASMGGSLARWH